jgi:predicted transcriptional regulator
MYARDRDTIGKKWSVVVLRHLSANDNMYFNELKWLLGISSNVLAKKLKQLEQEGLVTRRAVFEESTKSGIQDCFFSKGIRWWFHRSVLPILWWQDAIYEL